MGEKFKTSIIQQKIDDKNESQIERPTFVLRRFFGHFCATSAFSTILTNCAKSSTKKFKLACFESAFWEEDRKCLKTAIALAQYSFPDNVNTNIRRNMKTRRKKNNSSKNCDLTSLNNMTK